MRNPHSNPQPSSSVQLTIAKFRASFTRMTALARSLKPLHASMMAILAAALLLASLFLLPNPGKRSPKNPPTLSSATAPETRSLPTQLKVESKQSAIRTEKKHVAQVKSAEKKLDSNPQSEPQKFNPPSPRPVHELQLSPGALPIKEGEGEPESGDEVRARGSWFFDQRAYPLQHIPPEALQEAIRQRDLMKQRQRTESQIRPQGIISFPGDALWHLMGPQPVNEHFSVNSGFPTASGRVTAIAVDPSDATGQTVYIGGAAGGVWKTTDGGAHWTVLTDTQPSLAVGAIAIDPNNHLTIYVGTGEDNFSGDSFYGAGILKSTDGGNTWTQIGASSFAGAQTTQTGGAKIGGIAVQPGNSSVVLASVFFFDGNDARGGVWQSLDGGATWHQPTAGGQGAAGTGVVFESTSVASATGATAWAALGDVFSPSATNNGIWKSTDSGAHWTKQAGGLPTSNLGRITLGYAPSTSGGGATVYALIADSSTTSAKLLGMFKTVDGGTTWTAVAGPVFPSFPAFTGGFCSAQCFYDMAIGVHPTNPSVVVVGGGAGPDNFSSLFETINGGSTWTGTGGDDFTGGMGSIHPHVDTHAIVFTPQGTTLRLYVGNDGGMWRTDSPVQGTVSPTWVDLNATLAITQFYPGPSAGIGDENYGVGGTQDNDTEVFSGTLDWANVFACGDGGFTAIDPNIPTTVYTTCDRLAGAVVAKSVFNGSIATGQTFVAADSGIVRTDRAQFIPPLTIDQNNPNTLYFGTCRVYQTTDGANTWTPISGDLSAGNAAVSPTCPGVGSVTTMDVAHQNSNIILAGTSNGKVWETTTGGALWNEIDTGLPTRHVTAVRTKRNDATGMIAYVTFSGFGACAGCGATPGHVFKTTNGGATWTNISGDLPDIPVNDLIVDHSNNPTFDALYIGTDVGVFSCPDPEAATPCTNWTVLGDGLPNSPVLGLAMRRSSRILRAATHGRSMWNLQLTDQNPPAVAFLSSITPGAVNVGDPSTLVTFTGANFSANTKIFFDGVSIGAPTFVNTTQLTATVSSSFFTNGIVYQVSITDPAGADTSTLPFTVMNPILNAVSMTPPSTTVGTPVTLHFTGSNFVNGTSVILSTFPLLPLSGGVASSGGTVFDVPIPSFLLTAPAAITVNVTNPLPGGGPNPPFSFPFTINPDPNPHAVFIPSSITLGPIPVGTNTSTTNFSIQNVGGAALNITAATLTGTNAANFVFVAATSAPSCNFETTGIASVGAGASCFFGIKFSANTPPGQANSVATLNVTDNSGGTAGTVQHISVSGLVGPVVFISPVNFGAVTVNTTSPTMNSTVLSFGGGATVTAVGISGANQADFKVVAAATGPGTNPDCGAAPFLLVANTPCDIGLQFSPSIVGNETATISLTDNAIASPQSALLTGVGVEVTSISPSIVPTGGPAFTLTVNGGGFAPSAVVNLDGSTRLTTFVSANQLQASIPASDINTAGNRAITVTTPVPGGTTSEPKTLIVAQATVSTNDNITFATSANTPPFRITQDTTQATVDTGGIADPTPPCAPGTATQGGKARSVWFTATPPTNGRVVFDTRFSSYPTILSGWTGTPPGPLVAVPNACQSGNLAGAVPASQVAVNVTGGTKYFIMVTDASATGAGGTLTFSLDFQQSAPANDDSLNATVIAPASLPYSNTVNTIQATANTNRPDPLPPCAAGAAGSGQDNSVWYSFTPTSSGTITADTLTSPYDTILNVTSGTPAGAQVACNNDAAPGIAQSQVSFAATSGTTYFFMVSSFLGDGGTTNFHLTFSGAAIPSISFSPTPVPFGNQQVGTTSTTMNVTVTNSSGNGAALHITGTSIAGGNSLDFLLVAPTIGGTACPIGVNALTLAQGASCVMGIQFKPGAGGARNSNFNVNDDAAASPQSVPLTGTGTQPSISFNPTPLNFGNQQVGTTSATMNVTVTNNTANGDPLHITGTSIAGGANTLDFTLVAATIGGTPCPNGVGALTLAQGASCVIGIQFKPSVNGAENSNFSVTDDAAASPQSVPLNGTGTQPSISFNPTPVNFGNVTQGTTSATMNVTVTNNTANGDPLHITGTSVAGGANTLDFTLVAATIGGTPCPNGVGALTLAQGASCVIGIQFKPSTVGAENSNFSVTDDAAGSPQSVPLSGTGIAAVLSASLTPSPVPFGNQRVNTTGAAVTVTLTNTGTGTVTLAAANAVTITGTNAADFAIAAGTTCTNGAALAAPGGACVIKLTFKPGASGARTATINVSDNAAGSPQTATLNGTGIAPIATVTPSPLPFGNQRKGTTSATMPVTVKNTGTDTLNLAAANAIVISGANAADFASAPGVPPCANSTALAPAASCLVNVTFTPSTAAAEAATLTITDDSNAVPGSAQPVSLTGTGIFPQAVATPSPLPFGNQPKSTTSAPLTVTLTNAGTDTLHLAAANAVAISGANAGDFAIAAGTTCVNSAAVAAGGGNCIINVTFTPSTTAAEAATLAITDDVGVQNVSLTGTGTAANVTLSPSPVPFGNQPINTTSASMTVTLNNTGAASVTLAAANAVTITGTNPSDFAIVAGTTTCTNGLVVAATNGSCVINVTFKPTATGARSATLQVSDNAATSPQSVTLNGTGTAPTATVAPLNIPFANQRKGMTSAGTDVTVSNTGTGTLNIATIALAGANPTQFVLGAPSSGTPCSLVAATPVAPAANCKFSVKFAPTATGAQAATVNITDDSGGTAGTIQTVTLSGTGTLPQASAAPNPLPFGNQRKGTTSAALTVTLTNTGTDTLNLAAANAVAISGANAADFAVVAGTTTCKNSTAVPPAPGPGNTCVINVTFTPSTTAAEAATLTITDDSGGVAGTAQNVSLTGTGVLPQGGAAPATLAFGNQPKSVTSAPLTATLINSGSDTLNLAAANAVTITGANAADFAIVAGTTTCKNSTAVPPAPGPGNSCVINVTFTPSTTAAEVATLTITDDSGGVVGTTQIVSLTGTGTSVTVALSPSPAAFNNQRVGTTSAALTIILTNSGNGTVTLAAANAVSIAGGNAADFAITGGTCANSLALTAAPGPGNTCTVTATFKPSALGAENTTLTVTFQGGTPAAPDNLTGTGVFPQATPSPNPVNFNNQVINTTSGTMAATLTNGGTDVLHLAAANAVVIGGTNPGDFATAAGTTCTNGAMVNPGSNCVINLTFTPTALNARTATVTVTDDANPTTQVVTLNGTGTNPAPAITLLAPSNAIAGGPAFLLAITGTNFAAGATVTFGANPPGAPATLSSTQITINIPATDIATAGMFPVVVTNPAPGGGASAVTAASTFIVNNPAPTLTSISPTNGLLNQPINMTLTGTNFVAGSIVNFGANADAGGVVSNGGNTLTITIPAAQVNAAGPVNVTVKNPAPGGGTTLPQMFTVNNPAPTLTSIAPTSGLLGQSVNMTLTGTNFIAGSIVNFGANADAGGIVSNGGNTLTITIPAAQVNAAGPVNVTVKNPAPGGGTTLAQTFTVNNPAPTLTSVAPTSGVLGQAANLTLTGTNFITGSIVNFGANADAGGVVSNGGNTLTITIPAAQLNAAGPVNITVKNPAPGGGTSAAVVFTVNNPAPAVTSLAPPTANAGGPAFLLTVTGTNFVAGATVTFGANAASAPATLSSTQITINIPAADIATGGNFPVVVTNPAPGGGASAVTAASTFVVNNPVPTVGNAAVAGKTHISGGAAFTLTVTGTNFVSNSVVNFNGNAVTTHFGTATQLTADIPASAVAKAGNVNVTVTNPAPAGGTSAPPFAFTVDGFGVSGPANTNVTDGKVAMIEIDVTPTANGFTNPVTFGVTGLPKSTSFVFMPTSVTPGAAVGKTILQITTKAGGVPPTSPFERPPSPLLRLLPLGWLAALLAGIYAMFLLRRTPQLQLRRYVAIVPLALLLVTGAVLAGCAGKFTGTPKGAAPLVVTATSGTMSQTANVTLTVQ
jgi:hypothetical protein